MSIASAEVDIERIVNLRVSGEVRSWLARRRLTQGWLGETLEISRSAVVKKLRGDQAFSLTQMVLLADALDITLKELMGEALLSEKAPVRDADEGLGKLPQLDSNQQPLDYETLLIPLGSPWGPLTLFWLTVQLHLGKRRLPPTPVVGTKRHPQSITIDMSERAPRL